MDQTLASQLEETCRDFGIIGLWVFGSRANEITASVRALPAVHGPADADLDIGVLFPRKLRPDARTRVRIAAQLEDLLRVPRVDLVILGEASAFLALDIIRGEQLVDLDPRAAAEFELYVLRRAGDLQPFRREKITAVLSEGAR